MKRSITIAAQPPPQSTVGPLFAEALRQLDAAHRYWTVARKKQALARVLAGAGGDDTLLANRLAGLLGSWRSAPADEPLLPAAVRPDAVEVAPGLPVAIDGVPSEAEPQQRAQRLLSDLAALLHTICDTVPRLVEDEAWVRQQFDAIRVALRANGGQPDRHQLEQARALLERSADEHERLLKMRRDALQMMKTMVAQCIEWLRGLTASSERFGDRLGVYVEQIQRSTDLPALASTVHELIEDTRSMRSELESSKHDFVTAGERARRLEQEVEHLAQELRSTGTKLMTDHLTGLLNRRGLEYAFEALVRECRERSHALSLVLLDVDDFKRLNDTYGHQAGDDALRHLGGLLAERLRPGDRSARYGGEEFVLLLPGACEREAAEVVRRLQQVLSVNAFVHQSEPVPITFSAGVTQLRGSEPLEQVAVRADAAMYEAKRAGKNRVILASPGERLVV